jgi:ribonuclease HI
MRLYTDGGCHGNPGPGAWAWVLIELTHNEERLIKEDSGSEAATTNNRMELEAVIQGLEYCRSQEGAALEVITDSQYVKNGITSWIHNWKAKGWKTAGKQPVKNRELWEELDRLNTELQPQWFWVRGHAGNRWNERCDALTQAAIGA